MLLIIQNNTRSINIRKTIMKTKNHHMLFVEMQTINIDGISIDRKSENGCAK